MGYFNLIYQSGENNFLNNCKKSGVDGLIIVDLPYPENKNFANKCKKKSITFVQLLSPTTSKERLNKIYSKHTGKSVDQISDALERDNFMTAEEAKKFGLIDSVVEKRK